MVEKTRRELEQSTSTTWSSTVGPTWALLATVGPELWESSRSGIHFTIDPSAYAARFLLAPTQVEEHARTTATEARWVPASDQIGASSSNGLAPQLPERLRKVLDIAQDWGFAPPAREALRQAADLYRFLEQIESIAPRVDPPLAVVHALPDEDSGVSLYFERRGCPRSDRHAAITFHDDGTTTLSLTRLVDTPGIPGLQHDSGRPTDAWRWVLRIVGFLDAA